MVDAYKILKSLMKNLRRLILYLNTENFQERQSEMIGAIDKVVKEAIEAVIGEGEMISVNESKQEKAKFVG